jgi:hypothetical protein
MWGVRDITSPLSADWKPDRAARARIRAATPRAIPPAAVRDRKVMKASRRELFK